ncbi:MAG: hypothetical protein M2R45_02184 [Verrucomicrobia subdivision 3 bacterium]|nr:hypothetical protein [Limisphaerales bacterium]MCS1413760.1 hypothetical protein [Limisphaerales bacterium]
MKYSLSGTSDDYLDIDILDHGEGLLASKIIGSVERKRGKCMTVKGYFTPCIIEYCEGQTCSEYCRDFREGPPGA